MLALGYSADGIFSTFKEEAFRQEAVLAVFLIPISVILNVGAVEHLILVGSVLLVLICELMNSAIECVVDDISSDNRPLAKRAKDAGSAAVFISLINCFICWVWVLSANWGSLF